MPGTSATAAFEGARAWVLQSDLFAEGMGDSKETGELPTPDCQRSRKQVEGPEATSDHLTPRSV